MKNSRSVARIGAILCTVSWVACAGAQPVLSGLGRIPGAADWFVAQRLSVDGNVVVGSADSGLGFEACIWTADVGLRLLGDFPAGEFGSEAHAISASGRYVAGSGRSGNGLEAAIWDRENGEMSPLGDLSGGNFLSQGFAVSDAGPTVTGWSQVAGGSYEAFVWTPSGGMHGLGFLPGNGQYSGGVVVSSDASVIWGSARMGETVRLVEWRRGASGYDPPAPVEPDNLLTHFANCVDPSGAMLGGAELIPSLNGYVPKVWHLGGAGQGERLALPANVRTGSVHGLSLNGAVAVGECEVGPLLWIAGTPVLLVDYLRWNRVDVSQWATILQCLAISADGTVIVGNGVNVHGGIEGWRLQMPSPSVLCPADFTGDGFLDFFDYDGFVLAYEGGDIATDFNGDGFLDFFDYDAFVEAFEVGC